MAGQDNGSRKETAAWAIGAAAAGVITSFAAAVGVIQEPLERDVAALNRRMDEGILAATAARNELREQLRAAVQDSLARSEERLQASIDQQDQVDQSYGTALGELAARIARIEADRARLIENAIAQLQRIEEHLRAVDERLVDIEGNFTRVLRGDAVRPDRLGGPPYTERGRSVNER